MTDPSSLRKWFDAVDVDKSGEVSVSELQRALKAGGLDFSANACALLIRIYDKSRTGAVSFEEFGAMHVFILSVQESFVQLDRDQSGSLDRQEVHEALRMNGFQLDEPAFRAVFESCEVKILRASVKKSHVF